MAAALVPMGIAAGTAAAPYIGETVGKGFRKLGSLLGFKRGGTHRPKAMAKALQAATVKKTGPRVISKNMLVIPAGLAKKIKAVARRKPQVIHHKKKRKKK